MQPSIFFALAKMTVTDHSDCQEQLISSTSICSSGFNLSYFAKAFAIFIPGVGGIILQYYWYQESEHPKLFLHL
jgi:hypothetical protein